MFQRPKSALSRYSSRFLDPTQQSVENCKLNCNDPPRRCDQRSTGLHYMMRSGGWRLIEVSINLGQGRSAYPEPLFPFHRILFACDRVCFPRWQRQDTRAYSRCRKCSLSWIWFQHRWPWILISKAGNSNLTIHTSTCIASKKYGVAMMDPIMPWSYPQNLSGTTFQVIAESLTK